MPSAEEPHDVIVVGARVAGASTAMLLARAGHRVLVLDRAAPGSDTLSTHGLMKPGVLQLHRWGLIDRVVAAGTPPVRQTTIHYGDEAMVIPMKSRGAVDALYAPRRTVLDPILAEAATESGADVRYGMTATEVMRNDDGRVCGVMARDEAGRTAPYPARLVVGADGARSFIARSVSAGNTLTGIGASAVVYAYFSGWTVDGYEWFYRPNLTGGAIPTNGGVLGWVGTPPDRFRSELRDDVEGGFWRVFDEVAPSLADVVRSANVTSRFRSSPGMVGFHRQPWGPGWALVGDASHFKDPLSVHGMTDALRDAELLARAADGWLTGRVDEIVAFEHYQHIRDDLSTRFFEVVDRVASYDWDMAEIRELLMAESDEMRREIATIEAFDDEVAGTTAQPEVRS